MRHHVDFFRSRLAAPIGRAELAQDRLADWVNSPSASLSLPTGPGYPLQLNSLNSLDNLFAADGARFASIAFESLETFRTRWVTAEDRDGLAWRFVGLYYAAFYAAHAVLRFLGRSLTHVSTWSNVQTEFDNLYRNPSLPTLGLRNGYHCITLSPDLKSVEIRDANASGSAGSHAITWREFKDLADSAYANNSLNTSHQRNAAADYAGIIAQPAYLDSASSAIQWPWMPAMRNRINYRIPDDVWGPPAKRIPPNKVKIIHKLLSDPAPDRILFCASHQETSVRFVASCIYTLSILASLSKEMEQRATSKSLLPRFVSDRSSLLDLF